MTLKSMKRYLFLLMRKVQTLMLLMYFGEHDFQLKIVKYKIKLGQNLFL